MKLKTDFLFAELLIGAILLKQNDSVTIEQIAALPMCSSFSQSYIANALRELIACGIVTCTLQKKKTLSYALTEFGRYYYKELCNANINIEQLLNQIGSEI